MEGGFAKMFGIVVKAAILIFISHCVRGSKWNYGIQQFLTSNGHNYVDIIYNSSAWQGLSLRDIYFTRIHIDNIAKTKQNSFGIFLYDPDKDDIQRFLTVIQQRQIKMTLLIVFKAWDKNITDLIKKWLSHLHALSFFYMAMTPNISSAMTWHQVISLKSGNVMNNLDFANHSYKIIDTFDLHGLQITSTSLTWAPYLTIDNCNEFGLECVKNYGYLIDFIDKLALKFNFTYLSQKNVENDWGMQPKSGPFGINGTYGGVWGDILDKKYDMCLSGFWWTSVRDEMFSFVPLIQSGDILVMKPQHSEFDFGLFTRAFVGDTWICVFLMGGVLLSLICLANIFSLDEEKNGIKILNQTWWGFFVANIK